MLRKKTLLANELKLLGFQMVRTDLIKRFLFKSYCIKSRFIKIFLKILTIKVLKPANLFITEVEKLLSHLFSIFS
jgi:hypothetical protein